MAFSKKQIERIGTAAFARELYKEDIRIFYPDIDEGIDLIACSSEWAQFRLIQLKCFERPQFLTDQKYLKFPDLLMVYIWNVSHENLEYYAMICSQAENIV